MKADYGSLKRHKWALPFEAFMLGGAVMTFLKQDWLHLGTSLFTFVASFAPLLFERVFKVRLPAAFQVSYVAFIFLSMFLGEVFYVYGNFWQWDDIIHFSAGILIALGAVTWLTALTRQFKEIKVPVWLQVVFVYGVVQSIIVLWELVEFGSDQIFGTTSQGDLIDTMWDLVDGTAGAFIVCILLATHQLKRRIPFLERWIHSYSRLNK